MSWSSSSRYYDYYYYSCYTDKGNDNNNNNVRRSPWAYYSASLVFFVLRSINSEQYIQSTCSLGNQGIVAVTFISCELSLLEFTPLCFYVYGIHIHNITWKRVLLYNNNNNNLMYTKLLLWWAYCPRSPKRAYLPGRTTSAHQLVPRLLVSRRNSLQPLYFAVFCLNYHDFFLS